MRNLRRALSLALASVMTLGMMVVGASAATVETVSDFSDASEIQNVQAATINSAIGIFKGMDPDKGVFNPTGIVNRGQMAVIVSKMLGQDDNSIKAFVGTNNFTDKDKIPEWAQGWVDYAAANKIIVGREHGEFDAEAQVTTAEAAVMICKALGWFQNEKEFGENWKLAVTNKANDMGLYGDLTLTVDAGLTRDNVSELVFHGLTENCPVKYNAPQDTYYNTDQGWIGGYQFDYSKTLAYKNFSLIYANEAENSKTSVYGRPADKVWGTGKLDADKDINANGNIRTANVKLDKTLFTETASTDYTWTDVVSNKKVYDAIGSKAAAYAKGNVYEAGKDTGDVAVITDNNNDFGNSRAGRITEVYVNNDDQLLTIVYIDQTLGEISEVGTDADGAYIKVKGVNAPKYYTDQVFAKKDKVVYTLGADDKGNVVIASVYAPTVVDNAVVSAIGSKGSSITADGTRYLTNHTAGDLSSKVNVNDKVKLYLDNNGFVVGQDKIEGAASNYLFVLDKNPAQPVGYQAASVRFVDGSKKTIDVDGDMNNTIAKTDDGQKDMTAEEDNVYSYTESSGVYKLTNIEDKVASGTATIKQGLKALGTFKGLAISADSDTVYVNTDSSTTYTGVDNVSTFKLKSGVAAAGANIPVWIIYDNVDNEKKTATATYVFIDGESAETISNSSDDEYVYVTEYDAKHYDKIKIGDDDYYTVTAYKNGEKEDLTVKDDKKTAALYDKDEVGGVFVIKRDSKGYVTEAKEATSERVNVLTTTDSSLNVRYKNAETVVKFTSDCTFMLVDGDDVSVGDGSDAIGINDVDKGENYTKVYFHTTKTTANDDGSWDADVVILMIEKK